MSAVATELRMIAIGDGLPKRDDLRGEQTILTYNDKVGVWDIDFMEAGWGDYDSGFAIGVTHWLDITHMWPGVIAQVASFVVAREVMAWECKDYADGWIAFPTLTEALAYQGDTGCIMRPVRETATSVNGSEEGKLSGEILAELVRARTKFPGKNVTFAALVEEVGELATATFEESRDRVRKEAVQVAVMAMRMVLDGDHTFDNWRAERGLDPLTIQRVEL